jgi:outer membrane protein insertion porin family
MSRLVALGVIVLTAGIAWADQPTSAPSGAEDDEAVRKAAEEGADFGPLVTVEDILVRGNSWTAERLIRRALLVREGDTLRAGDPRFRVSRFRVLALGYFSDVALRLERGSARGNVVIIVDVLERGTFTISRIFLGNSEATPVWLGLDVGDANFFGSGIAVSGAVVWADAAEIGGAEAQLATRLRLADPSLFGTPFGLHATFLYNDASEPVRVTGDVDDGAPENFTAVRYERIGGIAGASWDFTRRLRLTADARVERVRFEDIPALTLTTLTVAADHDTRADPVLTYGGTRATLVVEGGAPPGDYEYVRFLARVSRWISVRDGHVVSGHLTGGWIVGDAPHFEQFYVGDWNRLITPRALDLVVSTRPSRNFLGTDINESPYSDMAASIDVEYAYRLFRKKKLIYGGDLFVGAGVFGFGLDAVDLTFDLGLRLDTEIGVFELSLGNGVGRIPL